MQDNFCRQSKQTYN